MTTRTNAKKPFDVVVSEHGTTVWRVCRAVVGPVDADDAWAETFLSAMNAYPDLPADANVEAWLVTIAHRKAIDVTRRAARHAVPVAEVAEVADRDGADRAVPEHGANVADTVDARLASAELTDAVDALPPKQRQAVAYHYLADLPYAEVAELIGGSAAAARRAAADGLATLRRTYAARANEETS